MFIFSANYGIYKQILVRKVTLRNNLRKYSFLSQRRSSNLSKMSEVTRKCLCSLSRSTREEEIVKCFQYALQLTKTAGKLILDNIYAKKNMEVKSGDIDYVTKTDQDVEKLLIDGLSKQFPNHKFIGEETVSSGAQINLTNDPTWIIDPIDGTMNFVHAFPHSCISVALFIGSVPHVGIIYNPVLDQLFTAIKHKGAFLNDKRIHVSDVKSMSEAIIMTEAGYSRDPEKFKIFFKNMQLLIPQIHGIRALGSTALNMAMVALGCADAYFQFEHHIWDIAAGELLITEAGGVVIDPSGGPVDRLSRRVLCASNKLLADEMCQKLVQFYPTPRD